MSEKELIYELYKLRNLKDNPRYHSEKNCLDHSFQCYSHAKHEHNFEYFHVAALFHDIGKLWRDEKLNKSPDHEKHSVKIMEEFGYKNHTVFHLIKNHMRMHKYLNGEMKKLNKIREITSHINFKDMVILARCDTMAREKNRKIPDIDDILHEINVILIMTNERYK